MVDLIKDKNFKVKESPSPRHAELIDIAAELFAQRGYTGTTVRDIAEAAGMLSGSLYHHFDSKEDTIDEILSRFIGEQLSTYHEIVERGAPPSETLKELIDASLASIDRHRHAIAIYQNEASFLIQIPRMSYLAEVAIRFEDVWTSTLKRGVESGDFRDDINVPFTYRFIRDSIWTVGRWYRPGGEMTIPVIAKHFQILLMEGLASGVKR